MKKSDKIKAHELACEIIAKFKPDHNTCLAEYEKTCFSFANKLVIDALDNGFKFSTSKCSPYIMSTQNIIRKAYFMRIA